MRLSLESSIQLRAILWNKPHRVLPVNFGKQYPAAVLTSRDRSFEIMAIALKDYSPIYKIITQNSFGLLYFVQNAQDAHWKYMGKICARFSQNAQYMRKIVLLSPMRNICARLYFFPDAQLCARMYFFPLCTIYAQDLRKIVLISSMRNICARLYFSPQCAIFAQDCRHYWEKYVTIYAQDCTYFPNVQYMCKICTRLYLFLQCAIYMHNCLWQSKNNSEVNTILNLEQICDVWHISPNNACNLVQILHIGERSTILCIYCALEK